jgi:hypothetical protein
MKKRMQPSENRAGGEIKAHPSPLRPSSSPSQLPLGKAAGRDFDSMVRQGCAASCALCASRCGADDDAPVRALRVGMRSMQPDKLRAFGARRLCARSAPSVGHSSTATYCSYCSRICSLFPSRKGNVLNVIAALRWTFPAAAVDVSGGCGGRFRPSGGRFRPTIHSRNDGGGGHFSAWNPVPFRWTFSAGV